jgi:hypothetical protein
MLIPVLNKQSTSEELAALCWLLNEINATCDDVNIRWKTAQLAYKAEELYEKFIDESNLFPKPTETYHREYFKKISASDKIEAMLSAALQSVATLDAARYEAFDPGQDFKTAIKEIRKETLGLLHEMKGFKSEEE